MQSDPERAIPVVIQILDSNTNSIKIKDKALFVIAQSGSPQAITILSKTALDNTKPELRNSAIRYLAISGGDEARKALASTYQTTSDAAVKKAVLRSFVITGDKPRLLQIAKTEPNADLRADAVRQLGIMGAKNELGEMYNTETSTAIRKGIIQAMFIGGNSEKLGDIARNEKDRELRLTAIRNLGLMGGERSSAILRTIYDTDSDREVKDAVIKAFFIQGNSHTLVELARREKDPELKKEIISRLSLMGSKEAADYLMEFLKE
jgi:HEAT repeat protein